MCLQSLRCFPSRAKAPLWGCPSAAGFCFLVPRQRGCGEHEWGLQKQFRQWARCVLVLHWEGNGIWDDLGAQSAPWTRRCTARVLGGRAGRGTAALVLGCSASQHPWDPPSRSQLPAAELGFSQERAACPFRLAPTQGAAPRRASRMGAPLALPLLQAGPAARGVTAGADPVHPAVGMLHNRS